MQTGQRQQGGQGRRVVLAVGVGMAQGRLVANASGMGRVALPAPFKVPGFAIIAQVQEAVLFRQLAVEQKAGPGLEV